MAGKKKGGKRGRGRGKKGSNNNNSNKKNNEGESNSWVQNISFLSTDAEETWSEEVDEQSDDDSGPEAEDEATSNSDTAMPSDDGGGKTLEATEDRNPHSLRIVSWNVLAEAYLSRRSHPNLPPRAQQVIFHNKQRRQVIKSVLSKWKELFVDVVCLQEVDMPVVGDTMKELGYDGIGTPTVIGGGAGGRVDACCIYWLQDDWELLGHEVVRLDDLATLSSTTPSGPVESDPSPPPSLQMGLQQSFLRRNMAILARLRHKHHPEMTVVVANAHLFWNPEYDYVKLCQAHHVAQQLKAFAEKDEPVLYCGDLNSQPSSPVHQYLSKGVVNAKGVAPWYRQPDLTDGAGVEGTVATAAVDDIADGIEAISIRENEVGRDHADEEKKEEKGDEKEEEEPTIRYLLDYTLNRYARWLRILGIDAALETEEEEIQRTKHANL